MRRARRPLPFSIAYRMTGALSSREPVLNEVREEPGAARVRIEVRVVDSQLEACTSRRRHKGAQQSTDLVDSEPVRIRTIHRRHHRRVKNISTQMHSEATELHRLQPGQSLTRRHLGIAADVLSDSELDLRRHQLLPAFVVVTNSERLRRPTNSFTAERAALQQSSSCPVIRSAVIHGRHANHLYPGSPPARPR
jgi:hypothetical protein